MSAKILPFTTKAEREGAIPSPSETVSTIKNIREMFTDEQVEQIKIDLESEEDDRS